MPFPPVPLCTITSLVCVIALRCVVGAITNSFQRGFPLLSPLKQVSQFQKNCSMFKHHLTDLQFSVFPIQQFKSRKRNKALNRHKTDVAMWLLETFKVSVAAWTCPSTVRTGSLLVPRLTGRFHLSTHEAK